MKYLKYAALVLFGLAMIAAVLHWQRESIARQLTNAALSGQGVTATKLSIRTLRTDRVLLSSLVLEQDDGARYEISGLSFPLSFPSLQPESIAIDQVRMTPAPGNAITAPPGRLLQGILQLPGSVPNTEITVSRFTRPDIPAIENIVWRSADQQQHLEFSIRSIAVNVDIDQLSAAHYQATVRAIPANVDDAFSATLDIRRGESGLSVEGVTAIDLSPWQSLLQSVGLFSDDIVSLGGRLVSQLRFDLDDDETQAVSVSTRWSLTGEAIMDYRMGDDRTVRLRANTSEPLVLDIEYPSLEWTAAMRQIDMFIGIESISDVTIGLHDIECQASIQCAFDVSLNAGPLAVGDVALDSVKLAASLLIADDEGTRIDVASGATLELGGIKAADITLASASAKLFSGLQLIIDTREWRMDVDRTEWVLDALTAHEGGIASLPLALNDIHVRDDGASIETRLSVLPQAAILSWEARDIFLPGVNGAISLHENKITTSLSLFDDLDAVTAQIAAAHDMETGEGSISIDNAVLYFDRRALSGHFPAWPYAGDVVFGTVSVTAGMNWANGDDGSGYDGTMTYRADKLAGNYDDIVFSGFNTRLSGSLDATTGMTLSPSSITIALLEVGVPLQEITANFTADVAEKVLQVEAVSMSALGGQLVADPFRFRMQEASNDIILRPKSIQLQFMVDLADFEDLELSGSISGMLPMTISDTAVTISNGRLENDPPGGVIRYMAGIDSGGIGASNTDLGLVTRALANFQFDSLTSDVDYTENGDLKLQMQLTGINPDMDDRQPVVLNLGVENNIPQLLRSLQATRSIEEILENRTVN